jgi:hypothetical protein
MDLTIGKQGEKTPFVQTGTVLPKYLIKKPNAKNLLRGQQMSTEQVFKAKLKWPVSIKANGSSSDGVTLNLSTNGAYIRCVKPLRLNEVFDMTLQVPNSDDSIEAEVEVVLSNIYGPDDDISPRGMIIRFLDLADEDRRIIAKAIFKHLESDKEKIDPKKLQTLQTLTIDPNEIDSEAA